MAVQALHVTEGSEDNVMHLNDPSDLGCRRPPRTRWDLREGGWRMQKTRRWPFKLCMWQKRARTTSRILSALGVGTRAPATPKHLPDLRQRAWRTQMARRRLEMI